MILNFMVDPETPHEECIGIAGQTHAHEEPKDEGALQGEEDARLLGIGQVSLIVEDLRLFLAEGCHHSDGVQSLFSIPCALSVSLHGDSEPTLLDRSKQLSRDDYGRE